MITELIARHILEVHEGGNWTESDLTTALSDVNVKEATMQTPASVNTIASLLHHLTFWNRHMVQRINGVDPPVPDDNGFSVPFLETEEAWQQLKKDNLDSAHELAAAIRSFDESRLNDPILPGHSFAYRHLQGSSEHIHYHLGQIVLLKQLTRAADSNS